MLQKALSQLLHSVAWPPLDILILDLPPGTGDTQLTITQQLILSGSVIVSTPQDIALQDAIKGVEMFKKVNVEILGLVQNMSLFKCPGCGKQTHIFREGKEGGVRGWAGREGVEVLGDVPLDGRVCEDSDRGVPTIVAEGPEGERAKVFMRMAERVGEKVGLLKPGL